MTSFQETSTDQPAERVVLDEDRIHTRISWMGLLLFVLMMAALWWIARDLARFIPALP